MDPRSESRKRRSSPLRELSIAQNERMGLLRKLLLFSLRRRYDWLGIDSLLKLPRDSGLYDGAIRQERNGAFGKLNKDLALVVSRQEFLLGDAKLFCRRRTTGWSCSWHRRRRMMVDSIRLCGFEFPAGQEAKPMRHRRIVNCCDIIQTRDDRLGCRPSQSVHHDGVDI